MQTKKQSLKESINNTFWGFLIALIAQWFIFPAYNVNVSFLDSIAITFWFTVSSVARNYLIRRYYESKNINFSYAKYFNKWF